MEGGRSYRAKASSGSDTWFCSQHSCKASPFPAPGCFLPRLSAVFAIAVTLLPIAQSALGPLGTPVWFLGSLISYLLVRTVLQPEFNTVASLRAPVLLCLPLICSAPMLFFGGSAMLAELAVVGAIAAAA